MSIDVTDNPVVCDCKDYNVMFSDRYWLDGVKCAAPPELADEEVRVLRYCVS